MHKTKTKKQKKNICSILSLSFVLNMHLFLCLLLGPLFQMVVCFTCSVLHLWPLWHQSHIGHLREGFPIALEQVKVNERVTVVI